MKTLFFILVSSFCILTSAFSQNHITASITFTNLTTNGMTFTVNGNVRTFTNNVVLQSVQVATNADATGCGSKTNLFNQIALNLFPLVSPPQDTGSNTFTLTGVSTNPLVVTVSAGYASISYSTQTVSSAVAVRIPTTIEAASVQTNIDSGLVAAINNPANTNSLNQNATVASQLVGTNNTQVISGQKTFNNTNNLIYGVVSSMQISGNSLLLTNGVYFTPLLSSPIFTNAVNYGNAFSSPGTNTGAEQFGSGATTAGNYATAVGNSASASAAYSTAIGAQTFASGFQSVAIGLNAAATDEDSAAVGASSTAGYHAAAFGYFAVADNTNASALGIAATSHYVNSTAIGHSASTTASNQVMVGSPGVSTVVQNNLTVQTNLTVGGGAIFGAPVTNVTVSGQTAFPAGSDIAFGRFAISSLANGGNAAVPVGTNTFIEVSGPSGAFSINGMANGRDGKLITILNQTGFQMTIANESGTDPTAANRIRTLGAAADLIFTNAACTFIYNANVSRWILLSHNP
jgi:trimeric autotransporter adhesin